MRRFVVLLLSALCACASCGTANSRLDSGRILFVGNSLTYVGNLPAVFSALATSNGHPIHSDMIVNGGATLSERVADGSVERAFKTHQYAALVLQERGGDLMCAFGPDSCTHSRQAIKTLASLGRQHDLSVVLLGSYQKLAAASRLLVEDESAAAKAAGIAYVEVSQELQHLRRAAPDLTWFDTDGMHPGKDLILLDAMRIYKELFGSYPDAKSFVVHAPIYTSHSGLTDALRACDAAPPKAQTPREVSYSSDTMSKVLAIIDKSDEG